MVRRVMKSLSTKGSAVRAVFEPEGFGPELTPEMKERGQRWRAQIDAKKREFGLSIIAEGAPSSDTQPLRFEHSLATPGREPKPDH